MEEGVPTHHTEVPSGGSHCSHWHQSNLLYRAGRGKCTCVCVHVRVHVCDVVCAPDYT